MTGRLNLVPVLLMAAMFAGQSKDLINCLQMSKCDETTMAKQGKCGHIDSCENTIKSQYNSQKPCCEVSNYEPAAVTQSTTKIISGEQQVSLVVQVSLKSTPASLGVSSKKTPLLAVPVRHSRQSMNCTFQI